MAKKGLFGTSGIRGDAEKLFTSQFCFDIGLAFAKYLDERKLEGGVAIGMDPRGSSPRIKDMVISGLWDGGREVYDQGATSVPSMCYALHVSEKYAGSIMVSGSHIKANLNGVKFFSNKEEFLKKDEELFLKIFERIRGKKKAKKYAEIHDEDVAKSEYMEMLVKLAGKGYTKRKVVVDPGNGAHSDTMPQVLQRCGIDVVEQNATIQGEFMARDTESIEDMKDLIKGVKKGEVDFGVGFDADGDRAVFVNKKGEFIAGDITAALVAQAEPGSSVVTPIATSQVVDHIGKKVVRTKVGSPYVIKTMKDKKINFGFEANGGTVSGDIMLTRDGGSTVIKFLNLLEKKKKTIEEMVDTLPKFYLRKTKVDYKWELQEKILTGAQKRFKGIKKDTTDGLKLWVDDTTWMLFRSSQNAPEFRVFTESTSKGKAEKLLKEGVGYVKEVVGSG